MTDILQSMERLNVLFELSLVNAPQETIYNKMTVFASEVIGTPVSLVSMVADNHQFFKSEVGLPEPYKSQRRTPFSHSFCKHVVRENKPLVVTDAREDPLVKNNLAIRDLNVIGYLGMPLTLSDGKSLGSLCVIDSQPREWTQVEIDIMTELAEIITMEFDVRAYVRRKKVTKDELTDLQNRIIAFIESVDVADTKPNLLQTIRSQRETFALV